MQTDTHVPTLEQRIELLEAKVEDLAQLLIKAENKIDELNDLVNDLSVVLAEDSESED